MHNKMLQKVADRLAKGWQKNDLGNYTSQTDDVCLAGAFLSVNYYETPWDRADTRIPKGCYPDEFRAMSEWIGWNYDGMTIPDFNDSKDTDYEEVQLALKKFDLFLEENPEAINAPPHWWD